MRKISTIYVKELEEEVKTFNIITNKDEVLQMYLKDVSKIKLLNEKEIIDEIARISTGNISKIALEHAIELRNSCLVS